MTKYKPEYCDMVVSFMAEGATFQEFGPEVGVCHKTLYNWRHQHPEFDQAVNLGYAKLYGVMMRMARKHLIYQTQYGPRLETNLFFKIMHNCFREEWDGKTEEQGQTDSGEMQIIKEHVTKLKEHLE